MLNSASLGDPVSASGDVYIDGNVITAENWTSAGRLAEAIAASVAAGRN
jgi:putative intracellular protease/amidase